MNFEPETLYLTIELLATWWVQALALILIGLCTAKIVRPASQSMVYRVAIVTVLMCPIFSQVLTSLGVPTIRLPIRPAGSSSSPAGLIAGQPRDYKIEVDSSTGSRNSTVPVGETLESRVSNIGSQSPGSPITSLPIETFAGPPGTLQSPAIGTSPVSELSSNSTIPFLISLVVAWACGTIVMLAKFVLELRSGQLLIGQSSPAEPTAVAECSRAAKQLGISRIPIVLVNPFLSSPCLVGHWRPVVLLPEDVSRDCYDQVFLHELAHLRRGDWLWNALGRIASAILWPQPLMMWMHRQSQLVAEEVCDDYVIEHGCSREGYLQQLLEIAGRSLPQPVPSSVSMVGFHSKLGRRAVRILDTKRRLSTRVGRLVASLSFVVAFAITTGVALVGFGRSDAANESEVETAAESTANAQLASDENAATTNENRPDDSPRTYSGKVLDFNGNPVGGATVLALNHRFDQSTNHHRVTKILSKAESTSDGSYSITFKPEDGDNSVSAEKAGLGPDHVKFAQLQQLFKQNKSELQLQLTRLKPISGRVIDTEGNPVSGATIKVIEVILPESKKSVDAWLSNAKPELFSSPDRFMMISNDPRVTGTAFPGRATWNEPMEGGKTVATNAQGQFMIEGIGEDSLIRVELSGTTIARRQALVVARDMKTILAFNYRVDDNDYSHYGASPTLVAGSTQPIRGQIKDAQTGSPIADAKVVLARIGKSIWVSDSIRTTTDSRGSFELLGAPLGGLHRVEVRPGLNQPYFDTGIDLPASADSAPLECVIELTEAKWIRGRITDEEGKPLIAKINYYPYRNNKNAELYRNFEQQISGQVPDDNVKSDSDGNFRIKAISGQGVLAATIADHSLQPSFVPAIQEGLLERIGGEHMPKLFNSWSASSFDAMVEVDFQSNATDIKQDLVFKRGSISKLVIKHSTSLESVAVLGTTFPPRFQELTPLKNSAIEVVGMYPGEARLVVVGTTDRQWGRSLVVQGDVQAIDVQLQRNAVVTGRVVDQDSNPVAQVQVNVSPIQDPVRDNWGRQIWNAVTDSSGAFKVHLPIGVKYRIWTYTTTGPNFNISVRPVEGSSYDLGDVKNGTDLSEQATADIAKP